MNLTITKKILVLIFLLILIVAILPSQTINLILGTVTYRLVETPEEEPAPPAGGGGGGGGGTGGGRIEIPLLPSCIENWTCTAWGECLKGDKRVRTCTDLNNCNTTLNKPITKDYCIYQIEENITNITEEKPLPSIVEKPSFISSILKYLNYILIIIAVIIIFLVILYYKKHHALEHVEKIHPHVKEKVKKGVKRGEITKGLERARWPKKIIKETLKKAEKEHYIEDLSDHIRNAIEKGYTEKQIKESLKKANWPTSIINNALKQAKQEFHIKSIGKEIRKALKKGISKKQLKKMLK